MEIILLSLALFISAFGTYTDFRWREVPDWANFAGIILGMGLSVLAAVLHWDIGPIFYSTGGLIFGWFLGTIMFYTGQWGGGDSKMLMALGSLLGFSPKIDNLFVNYWLNEFFIGFLLWVCLIGGIYGLIWCGVLAMQSRKSFKHSFFLLWRESWVRQAKYLTLLAAGIGFVFFFVFEDVVFKMLFAVSTAAVVFLFCALVLTKVVELSCMIRRVSPKTVTAGDWIAQDVIFKGKRICGPKDLGISKTQLAELQLLCRQKKVKSVLLKVGIPFVPCFFLALTAMLLWGNPLLFLLGN